VKNLFDYNKTMSFIHNGASRCSNGEKGEYFKSTNIYFNDIHISIMCNEGDFHATLESNKNFPSLLTHTINALGHKVHKYHYGYLKGGIRPGFWIANNHSMLYESSLNPEEIRLKNKLKNFFLEFKKQLKSGNIHITRLKLRSNIKTKSKPTPPSEHKLIERRTNELIQSRKTYEKLLEASLKVNKKIGKTTSKNDFRKLVQYEQKPPIVRSIIDEVYKNITGSLT